MRLPRPRLAAFLATFIFLFSCLFASPALAADDRRYDIATWYRVNCSLLPCLKYYEVPLRRGYYDDGYIGGLGEKGFGKAKIEDKHEGELTWDQIRDTLLHADSVRLDRDSSTRVVFRKKYKGKCGCLIINHSTTWWARVVVEYAPSRSAPDQDPLGILTAYHEH
ncbi:hypothetical protein MXD59_25775 [Frankia sp. Ag45/Mut15]|uniref:Uncharacterized protein n=1 Tax=Frankia umida TaxID=573489 RepID=A0ABT0K5P5_9ACTN|nr:hypothetical protein [Frankia umida]MCK9879119.1 hypothetical protein [Frankia umida]